MGFQRLAFLNPLSSGPKMLTTLLESLILFLGHWNILLWSILVKKVGKFTVDFPALIAYFICAIDQSWRAKSIINFIVRRPSLTRLRDERM